MRIAFVTEVWAPSINGVVTRLTGTIAQLRRAGHDILVIAPRGSTVTWEPGLRVRTVPAAGVSWIYGGQRWGLPMPRVRGYLDEFQPDVVHVVNPTFLGVAGVLAARWRRLPLVCSYHTDVAAYAAYYHLGWLQPAIWWHLRNLHRVADVNLATSASAVAQLEGQGVPRVQLWRRGVDLDRYRPGAEPADRPPTVLYVGRLAEEKGIEALAELTAPDRHLPARLAGLRLVVVGDGPAREAVAEALGPHHAELTGRLVGEPLADAYRHADVFVFPSRTDTLGLVMLEALASGLPVVAAESPASREVLGGCPVARLFRPDHEGELTAAVADIVGRSPDHAAARAWVEGYGWAATTAELVTLYRRAIAARVSRGRRPPRRRRLVEIGRRRLRVRVPRPVRRKVSV
ncbi:MAG TPA: glycosyltransferase family 1 protein [Acidimicrobiales bacterium]|nr:glycosyltransferase family 1 protein [Acidimicrobiales bacterium]